MKVKSFAWLIEYLFSLFGIILDTGVVQLGDVVFSDLPRIRLDGGGRQFRRRWGYDGGGGGGPGSLNGGAGHLEDIEEDGDDFSDTYSLRGEASYNLHEGKSSLWIIGTIHYGWQSNWNDSNGKL